VIVYMFTMSAVGALSEVLQWQDGLLFARGMGLGFIWLMIIAGVGACLLTVIAFIRLMILYMVGGLLWVITALK